MIDPVETWLSALSVAEREVVDRLRAIVRRAAPELTETIKWNSPNFADGDQDRVTLGLDRKGGARLVLHRGAAVKDTTGFVFEDPDRAATWPAPDRGVAAFRDLSALEAKAEALEKLVRRWVETHRMES